MPLEKGSSQATIGSNIRELHTGKTYAHTSSKFGKKDADRQAVAIAINQAKGRAFGGVAPMLSQAGQSVMPTTPINGQTMGVVPPAPLPSGLQNPAGSPGLGGSQGFAFGGGVSAPQKTFKGPIVSSVPGRTDKHFTHVPSGSYVIPADIVSGHGQGNTIAGMHSLQKLFKMGPHASISSNASAFHSPKLARGGSPKDQHVNKPVRVKLAGGEIVVPPENVHETMSRVAKKKLTLDQAHQIMDKWVLTQRKKLRKTLARLPGPAHD